MAMGRMVMLDQLGVVDKVTRGIQFNMMLLLQKSHVELVLKKMGKFRILHLYFIFSIFHTRIAIGRALGGLKYCEHPVSGRPRATINFRKLSLKNTQCAVNLNKGYSALAIYTIPTEIRWACSVRTTLLAKRTCGL